MERTTDYKLMADQLKAITEDIPYETANLANAAAILWENLADINWAGFYKMQDGKLVLGPFQGKTACIVIPVGRGVCGTAVAEDKTQLVYDVHRFPGHIACDSASNSEIVIPLHVNGEIWGVLDIDSPFVGRFDENDKTGLEQCIRCCERVFCLAGNSCRRFGFLCRQRRTTALTKGQNNSPCTATQINIQRAELLRPYCYTKGVIL